MRGDIRNILRLLWRRFPYIALYAVAFYGIFFVSQRAFYQFAPATFFLDYYKVNVPATPRHYEGDPIPFTVCRHKKGNYPIRGYRIIYKLPDENSRSKQQAKQVANYPIDGQITQNECSDVTINPKSYRHEAGSYYFKTVLNFSVHGFDKQVVFESNTYTVEIKPLTPYEIQARIEQLEREIEALKLQLAIALAQNGTSSATQGGGAATTLAPRRATNNNQNANTQTPTNSAQNNTDSSQTNRTQQAPPSEQPKPIEVFGIPACVPIINVCVNR